MRFDPRTRSRGEEEGELRKNAARIHCYDREWWLRRRGGFKSSRLKRQRMRGTRARRRLRARLACSSG